jgi:hypothetical protein
MELRWPVLSRIAKQPEEAGLRLVPEAFADRRYNLDGTLQSRAIAGSVLVDPNQAAHQVLRIVREGGRYRARWFCRRTKRAKYLLSWRHSRSTEYHRHSPDQFESRRCCSASNL